MGSWFIGGPSGPFRASAAPGARRRLRQVAGAVSLLLAVETAMVAESTGQAMAETPAAVSLASESSEVSGPAEAADKASAVLMARSQGRKIEVLSERTADSTTYALPSGELQTSAYAGPVRVQQDGAWQDIDTSLSDSGPSLTPQAAAADITVSDGGDTALASVTKGGRSFGLGWEDKLPAPVVTDNTAAYDLGGGQELTVTALAQGFSQNVVLDRAPDRPVSYRIPMDLDGLKLSQADSGHLLLKDTDGRLVAEASAPMMWDSTKNDASGESDHQAQVGTTVETAGDGRQTLVLTPAADFLATATYPVTVDPTSTLAVTTDTWVQTPDYLDSQLGSQELKSGTYDGGSDVARSFMKFDVSNFVGETITDANLALYSYYSSSCSPGAGTRARRVTSDWSSSSITWGDQPTTTTANAVVNTGAWGYNSSCPANWSHWNLTDMVQDWANGLPNYGIRINSAGESDSLTWRRYRSANYTTSGYAPKLTVTYEDPDIKDDGGLGTALPSGGPTITAQPTSTDPTTATGPPTVSGKFTLGSGAPLANRTVNITAVDSVPDDGTTVTATSVGTATTASDGTWSFTLPTTLPSDLQALADANGGVLSLEASYNGVASDGTVLTGSDYMDAGVATGSATTEGSIAARAETARTVVIHPDADHTTPTVSLNDTTDLTDDDSLSVDRTVSTWQSSTGASTDSYSPNVVNGVDYSSVTPMIGAPCVSHDYTIKTGVYYTTVGEAHAFYDTKASFEYNDTLSSTWGVAQSVDGTNWSITGKASRKSSTGHAIGFTGKGPNWAKQFRIPIKYKEVNHQIACTGSQPANHYSILPVKFAVPAGGAVSTFGADVRSKDGPEAYSHSKSAYRAVLPKSNYYTLSAGTSVTFGVAVKVFGVTISLDTEYGSTHNQKITAGTGKYEHDIWGAKGPIDEEPGVIYSY